MAEYAHSTPTPRRAFLGGLAALPLLSVATRAAPLSPADARLITLADRAEALERACDAYTASRCGWPPTDEEEDAFGDLCGGFGSIEEEIAATPADGLAGILAKARAAQVPTMRAFDDCPFALSLADDVLRLFGRGVA